MRGYTAAAAAPQGDAPARIRGAAALYQRYCARCHGDDYAGSALRDRGRRVPDFTSARWQDSRSDAQLVASIREGRGAGMPAFGDRLSREQARDLVLLIRRADPTRLAGAADEDDFDRRYAALKRELQDLRRQLRELTKTSRTAGQSGRDGPSVPTSRVP